VCGEQRGQPADVFWRAGSAWAEPLQRKVSHYPLEVGEPAGTREPAGRVRGGGCDAPERVVDPWHAQGERSGQVRGSSVPGGQRGEHPSLLERFEDRGVVDRS
jgi:hypothetical protein